MGWQLDDKNETPIIVDASFFWGSINIMFMLQYISTLIDQQIYGMYRMFVASLLRIYEMLYHLISFIYSLYKIDILRSNKVKMNCKIKFEQVIQKSPYGSLPLVECK